MSDDTIYREDAIKALKSMLSDDINTSILFFWQNQTVGRGIDKIKNLPSADRPQGKWKHLKEDEWFCSECGHVIWIEGSWDPHPLERGKYYCEHCGAKMKGADDE